jgi:small-conductance mechanosensitive channel
MTSAASRLRTRTLSEGAAVMPHAIKSRPQPHLPRISLNNDGRRHPLENGLAIFTLVAGLVAFAVGWVVSQHVLASAAGIGGLAVGLYAQLISATRPERMLIVTGLVAAFVGAALGLAHGGFYP